MGSSPGGRKLPVAPRRMVPRERSGFSQCRPRRQPPATRGAPLSHPSHFRTAPALERGTAPAKRQGAPARLGCDLWCVPELPRARCAARAAAHDGVPPLPRAVRDRLGRGDLELPARSEEHTSELQSQSNLVCRLLLEKKKNKKEK